MNHRNTVDPRPFLAAAGIASLILAVLFFLGLSLTNGHISYVLDDAYIHMAMAKNFALNGVWGITQDGFTSSSSSLVWTFLLAAGFKVMGLVEWLPLAMNGLLVLGILYFANRALSTFEIGPIPQFIALMAILFLSPLPTLAFTGQEHLLHTLITLMVAVAGAKALAEGPDAGIPHHAIYLCILGPLCVLARFEGLFLLFLICCLFLLQRRIAFAFLLGGITLLPIVLFGAYSVSEGWLPLPNSVLMKGNLTKVLGGILHSDLLSTAFFQNLSLLFGYAGFKQLTQSPHLLGLVILGTILFIQRLRMGKGLWEMGQVLLMLFITTTLLHVQFAKVGWFFRYEAYLMAFGLFALGAVWDDIKALLPSASVHGLPGMLAGALVAFFLITPMAARALDALDKTPQATKNIHDQQYQMGRFLGTYYNGTTVTANDIGAINYLAEIGCVDLVGLASMDAATRRRTGTFNQAGMAQMSKDAGSTIAMAYESWLVKWGGVPKNWVKVGEWTIPKNVVVAHDTVSFYAIDPAEVPKLKANLRAFSAQLPDDIIERGAYLEGGE